MNKLEKKKKIRVLHVIEKLNAYGGTPIKLLWQIKKSSHLFEFVMCCIVTEGTLANKFKDEGIEVISLNRKKNYDLKQIIEIVNIIRDKNIDIVHTHFARSNTYGRISAILLGRPIIVSEHGIKRNVSLPVVLMDNFLSFFTRFHVCNSFSTERSVKQAIKFNNRNLRVIYNGVPDIYTGITKKRKLEIRKKYGFSEHDFIILNVGSHIPLRDQKTLINAVARIENKIDNISVVLIGDGETHGFLSKKINQLHLNNIISLWKRIPRESVHEFLHVVDLFVNPALLEGFGIGTVEAMLCELPVICAESGSLPELIEDDKDGLLFEPGNEQQLSEAIMKFYDNKTYSKEMGKNARINALKKFNVDVFARKFESLYLNMICSSSDLI